MAKLSSTTFNMSGVGLFIVAHSASRISVSLSLASSCLIRINILPVLHPDPKICTLTPNGHLDLAPMPNALGVYPAERLSFALGSRKNSVSSLGRTGLEQRTLVNTHPAKKCKRHRVIKITTCHLKQPRERAVISRPFCLHGLAFNAALT